MLVIASALFELSNWFHVYIVCTFKYYSDTIQNIRNDPKFVYST